MVQRALIRLDPTKVDLAIARGTARHVTPSLERLLRVVTWAADEKVLLAAAAAFWAVCHLGKAGASKSRANHLLICATTAAALPHLGKRLIDRERPDRVVVHGLRHGIGRSGNAWDSFPPGTPSTWEPWRRQ